jgi:hypothetical protein
LPSFLSAFLSQFTRPLPIPFFLFSTAATNHLPKSTHSATDSTYQRFRALGRIFLPISLYFWLTLRKYQPPPLSRKLKLGPENKKKEGSYTASLICRYTIYYAWNMSSAARPGCFLCHRCQGPLLHVLNLNGIIRKHEGRAKKELGRENNVRQVEQVVFIHILTSYLCVLQSR